MHVERRAGYGCHPIEQQRIQPVRTGKMKGAVEGGEAAFSWKIVKTATEICIESCFLSLLL
jgi:hypothetical protein